MSIFKHVIHSISIVFHYYFIYLGRFSRKMIHRNHFQAFLPPSLYLEIFGEKQKALLYTYIRVVYDLHNWCTYIQDAVEFCLKSLKLLLKCYRNSCYLKQFIDYQTWLSMFCCVCYLQLFLALPASKSISVRLSCSDNFFLTKRTHVQMAFIFHWNLSLSIMLYKCKILLKAFIWKGWQILVSVLDFLQLTFSFRNQISIFRLLHDNKVLSLISDLITIDSPCEYIISWHS